MSPAVGAGPRAVFVVDHHRTFTELLKVAIDREPDLKWAGSAVTVDAALVAMSRHVPDLVVIGYEPDDEATDGLWDTPVLTQRYPTMCVVILTGQAHMGLVDLAARAGACALMPKSARLAELLDCLRTAAATGFILHRTLLPTLVSPQPSTSAPTSR